MVFAIIKYMQGIKPLSKYMPLGTRLLLTLAFLSMGTYTITGTLTDEEAETPTPMEVDSQQLSLESLPNEVLLNIFQKVGGNPLNYRTISKKVNSIVTDRILAPNKWLVIEDREILRQYLSLNKIREDHFPKVRIDYRISDDELSQLVQVIPHTTHIEITDCTDIKNLFVLSQLNLSSLVMGIYLKGRKELERFPQFKDYPLTSIKVYATDFSNEDLKRVVQIHPYLIKIDLGACLKLGACEGITNAGLQHLPKSLTELNLTFARITGKGIQQIAVRCPQLTRLTFGCNRAPIGLQPLKELPLEYLSVRCFGGLMDNDLQYLPKTLQVLDLRNTAITSIASLKELTHLTELRLCNMNITDISNLRDLPSLAILRLHNTKITDKDLQYIPKSVTTLDLIGIEITDTSHLRDFPNLTTLNLSGTNITDISALAGLTNLTELNLKLCKNITDFSVLRDLINLTTLNLSHTKITDKDLQYIPKNLTKLYLIETEITDFSSLKDLPNLAILRLHNTKITDKDLQYIPKSVTTLNLSWCKNITDLSNLGDLPNLITLDLINTDIIDNALQYIPKNTIALKLSYTNIRDISSLKDLPNLITLDLVGCKNISSDAVSKLGQRLPNLHVIR